MTLPDALAKGAIGAACTVLVALGGAVISATRDNAVQDRDLAELRLHQQTLDDTLLQLDRSVQQLDKSVAVLNQRLRDRRQDP